MAYKVSILIPVYGVEQYIERCARSLFEQSYPKLEYVFVDDFTPDKSIEVLRQVIEDYPERKAFVKIINHEKNCGLAAARNTALDNATGDFVFHVDSDDWVETNAIELLVRKQIETNADMVSGNAVFHQVDGIWHYYEPTYADNKQMVMRLIDCSIPYNHSVWRRIIRRSLYEQNHVRAIIGNNVGEDLYQMVLLSWFAKRIGNVNDFVYHYERRNVDSMTHLWSENQNVNERQLLGNWFEVCGFLADKERDCYEEALRQTLVSLRKCLSYSVKNKERDTFHLLVEMMDGNAEVVRLMGWERTVIRGRCKRNFFLQRIEHQGKRMVRFVRRKWGEHS